MSSGAAGQVHCSGRFSFAVAEEMDVAGRHQSIYRANVSTIRAEPRGLEGYWKDRVAKIDPMRPRLGELQPGVKSAWYGGNPTFPNILTLEVAKGVGSALLVVDFEALAGKENVAETLVGDIVKAYVPVRDRGFCVGNGAIMLGPSRNEEARLVLKARAFPEVEIKFETRTVREPDTTTYSDLEEETQVASAHGGSLAVLREGPRIAAGLSGKEIGMVATIPGEPTVVRFTWHYPGVGGNGTRPSIDIVGSAPGEKRAQLETIWNSVLSSLQALPLPPAESR